MMYFYYVLRMYISKTLRLHYGFPLQIMQFKLGFLQQLISCGNGLLWYSCPYTCPSSSILYLI
jgi:hypothetical protein